MRSNLTSLTCSFFLLAFACGGAIDRSTEPTTTNPTPTPTPTAPNPLPPNTPNDGGAAEGAATLPAGILAVVPPLSGCTSIVGKNAHDLWCLRHHVWDFEEDDDVVHWNGTSWSAPIAFPHPAGNGRLRSAVPVPSGLLVGTSNGVAEIHPDGTTRDATPPAFSLPNGTLMALGLEPRDAASHVRMAVGKDLYTWLGGTEWTHLPTPLPGDVVRIDSDWLVGEGFSAEYLNATDGYLYGLLPFGILNNVVAGRELWSGEGASYCPDWCHPGQEPRHEALVVPWTIGRATLDETASPPNVRTDAFNVDVPDDVPRDGSIAYAGKALLPAPGGRLALVGCTTPKPSSSERAKILVHTWEEGKSVGPARILPTELLQCPDSRSVQPPLLDGTWVLLGNDWSLVLFAP